MDEPHHPRLRLCTHDHSISWSAQVDAADAYLHQEWQHEPIGFVTYGGVAAGTRAVQHLKRAVTTLRMLPVSESVSIPIDSRFIGEDGRVHANETMQTAADTMLDELVASEQVLRPRPASAAAA